MNGNRMMYAIGNIDEKYIMEFLHERTLKINRFITKKSILTTAACLCLIIFTMFVFEYSTVPQTGEQIWGTGIADNEVESCIEQAAKGKIVIANSLKDAIDNSRNKNDLFAIMVTETSGADKETIYNSFVLPFEVDEDYMRTGIIFATEEQINSFVCPSNLSIILFLADKPHEDIFVDESLINKKNTQKMKVKIYLKYDVDEIILKHQDELSKLNDEDYQIKQQEIIKTAVNEMLKEFLEDYDITDQSVSTLGIFIPKFHAELDTELILKIKDDNRVELVLEDTEVVGLDQ